MGDIIYARAEHNSDNPYTMVTNSIVNSYGIDNSQLGLIVRLLNLSDSFNFSFTAFARLYRRDYKSIRSKILELEKLGFCKLAYPEYVDQNTGEVRRARNSNKQFLSPSIHIMENFLEAKPGASPEPVEEWHSTGLSCPDCFDNFIYRSELVTNGRTIRCNHCGVTFSSRAEAEAALKAVGCLAIGQPGKT